MAPSNKFLHLIPLVLMVGSGCCHRGPDPADARTRAAEICRKAIANSGSAASGQETVVTASPEEKMLAEMLRYGDATTRKTIENFTSADVSVEILARVESQKERLFLLWRDSGWHLAGGGLLESPPRTPWQALARLGQALSSGDCLQLLALAPPEVVFRLGRERIIEGCKGEAAELTRKANQLQKIDPEKLRPDADRLVIELDDKSVLRLVKIEGSWYVDDL